jgi:hypothetical protein
MKKTVYLVILLAFAFIFSSCKDFWHPEGKTYATIIVKDVSTSGGCTNLVLHSVSDGTDYQFKSKDFDKKYGMLIKQTEIKVPAGTYYLTAVAYNSGGKVIRSENFTVAEEAIKIIEYYQSSNTEAKFRMESTGVNATIIVRRISTYGCESLALHTVPVGNEYQFNPGYLDCENYFINENNNNSGIITQTEIKVPAGTYYLTAAVFSYSTIIIRSENFKVATGATKIIYYHQSRTDSTTDAEFRMD